MNRYSAIIADDEENLCNHLKVMLKKLWPELMIVGTARNGLEALILINKEEPDIAFLDIKMPIMNGIKVAMSIPGFCHVVFITAYDEFAIQAFEQDAIDYILKPVSDERLIKTIKRLKNGLSVKTLNQPDLEKILSSLLTKKLDQAGTLKWIHAGYEGKTLLVSVDDVLFFRASDKYTSMMTNNNEHIIRKSIKELIAELDINQFWQINRGIIVNVNYIDSINRDSNGRYKVQLKENKEVLIVSRKYSHLFKQM